MKPEIRIFQTIEQLSHNAAELFADQAARSIEKRGQFLVALNGGGTPKRLFELLGSQYRDKAQWEKTHVFWGDERLVHADDPESSYGQARKQFLQHVAIPESNIHPVNGMLLPEEAANEYAQVLRQFAAAPLKFPRFDLVYLGMGEDGHTASLFPNSAWDASEPVIAVTAQYQDRPAHRVTMTPLVFNQARMVVFMAAGEKKAATLAEVLSGRYDPELYPAQRIEPKDGKLFWLVDEDAADKLPNRLMCKYCEG